MAGIINLSKQKKKTTDIDTEINDFERTDDPDYAGVNRENSEYLLEKSENNGSLTLSHQDILPEIGTMANNYILKTRSFCNFDSVDDNRDTEILMLVEKIQGRDMNFFDEALAISKLIRCYGLTQEDAAQKLGRAQSTIANKLRLLRLTGYERELILANKLTERHARSLLKLASPEDRVLMLDKIIDNNLNVEHTENMIENFIGKQKERNNYKKRSKLSQNVNSFISTLNRAVEAMQANGIVANTRKINDDDYIEYRVRIAIKH